MKKLEKILLVDDDKANNYINEQLLKELDISKQIHVATSGYKALQYVLENCESVHKTCPELIIFDHYMPIMNGMEFIKELHKIDFINKHEVIFILLGIHSKPEDIQEFKRLGVQEFTSKPLSKEVLLDAYQEYFSRDTAKNHTF